MQKRRSGYTLFQLLAVLAILLILLGMLLPAIQRVRLAAQRMQSSNNIKQIALAVHNYADVNGSIAPGMDANQFSGLVYLLPYLEQDNLYKSIDLNRSPDHADNAKIRGVIIKTYLSPLDTIQRPEAGSGPTSYFLSAGTNHALADNNGIFYGQSQTKFNDITDGTSNTIFLIESLLGDGQTKAVSVKRQHIRLKKGDLKGLQDTAGTKEFADNENVFGYRGSSWMDGKFLRSTINVTRKFNDERPDVDCGGEGGLAGPRSFLPGTNVGFADGSVRFISSNADFDVWKGVATRNGGEVVSID